MIHVVNHSQQNISIVMVLVIILARGNTMSHLSGKLIRNNKTQQSSRNVFCWNIHQSFRQETYLY